MHKQFARTSAIPPQSDGLSINDLPKPRGGLQLHYYDVGKRRDELMQESRTMYSTPPDIHHAGTKKTTTKRPSIYNEHAKNGFKFWLDKDPHVKKISLYSKYTFGSKHTVHGLGNAPRN
ncbi:hypothetical protein AC249_AIPGENE18874 [Exaiptasia diaphana]|nr:hypothetical protein AC249_AIPGENE18874 [Exaiptasia diaphana]